MNDCRRGNRNHLLLDRTKENKRERWKSVKNDLELFQNCTILVASSWRWENTQVLLCPAERQIIFSTVSKIHNKCSISEDEKSEILKMMIYLIINLRFLCYGKIHTTLIKFPVSATWQSYRKLKIRTISRVRMRCWRASAICACALSSFNPSASLKSHRSSENRCRFVTFLSQKSPTYLTLRRKF